MSNELEKLKKLAKEFDLKFNKKWFKYILISKRENILIEYIWMCPDPVYTKYGKSPPVRIKNVVKFVNSKEFQDIIKRYGGQVIKKKSFDEYFFKRINKIKDIEIKGEYLRIYNKIKKALGNSNQLAILTKTSKKQEKENLRKLILLHEWIHVLLDENSLNIENNWKYNEGLVTYLQEFLGGRLNMLESNVKKIDYNFEKQYFIYAIKFRELLKNIKESRQRKKKILIFIRK